MFCLFLFCVFSFISVLTFLINLLETVRIKTVQYQNINQQRTLTGITITFKFFSSQRIFFYFFFLFFLGLFFKKRCTE